MPNSVPVRDCCLYMVGIQNFVEVSITVCAKKASHNDRMFIRMKSCGFYDLINIFALQNIQDHVFKNRSAQSRK